MYDVWAGWDLTGRAAEVNRWTVDTHGPNTECIVTTMLPKSIGKRRAKQRIADFTPMNPLEALQLAFIIFERKDRRIVSILYNGQELLNHVDLPEPAPEAVVGVNGIACV